MEYVLASRISDGTGRINSSVASSGNKEPHEKDTENTDQRSREHCPIRVLRVRTSPGWWQLCLGSFGMRFANFCFRSLIPHSNVPKESAMAVPTATFVRHRDEPAGRWLEGRHVNVGRGERLASLGGGIALAAFGLSRGSATGYALAALGGALAYRGATGYCPGYQSLGISSAESDNEAVIPSG